MLNTMSAAPIATTRVLELAQSLYDRSGIHANAYLTRLESGAMGLEEFRRSQEQFFNAVTFFPRPMATLIARIPDPRARLAILRNLVEEHGDFQESAFHHSTFLELLRRIGADPESAQTTTPMNPAVRAFNATLAAACALDELEVGLCAIGAIELAFAGISQRIGSAIVTNQWIAPEQLVHYALHADIDPKHAAEFFAVVEASFGERRYWIDQGIRLGFYAIDRLYRDLQLDSAPD